MNQKITKTEFKKWGQQLLDTYTAITSPSSNFQFQNEASRKEWMQLGALTSINTKCGVIQAVVLGVGGLSLLGLRLDIPIKEFDGKTFKEWGKEVVNRIKEHVIANGYYKPDSPLDPVQLKEKTKKIFLILLSDNKEIFKYLAYANEEEKEYFINIYSFLSLLNKNFPGGATAILKDLGENKEAFFLLEDLVQRMEKLIALKEAAENPGSPSSPTSPPNNNQENLEAEIGNLRNQVKELENLLARSPDNKENYQSLLKKLQKELENKEREKNSPSQNQQSNSKPNDNKLTIAIVLGAAAVAIGLVCLVAIATNKKKNEVF